MRKQPSGKNRRNTSRQTLNKTADLNNLCKILISKALCFIIFSSPGEREGWPGAECLLLIPVKLDRLLPYQTDLLVWAHVPWKNSSPDLIRKLIQLLQRNRGERTHRSTTKRCKIKDEGETNDHHFKYESLYIKCPQMDQIYHKEV